jgi:DNA-binding transcriptional regulator YdaS (Cro superfamily)
MQKIDEERARVARAKLAPIADADGAVRRLALGAGLSQQTVRSVISTGVVTSVHTAHAIEAATEGAVLANDIIQPGARGEDVYGKFPGSAILQLAIARRCSPGAILASVGITHQDLNAYSKSGERAPHAVRTRLEAGLRMLALTEEGTGQ